MWQVDGGKSLKKNPSSSSGTQAASENALGTPWPRSELHVQSVQRTDKMSEARTLKSVSFLLFSNRYSVCVCRSVLQVRCVYIYINIYICVYFSSKSTMFYLSSSEEVEVVSWGCQAGLPLPCSSSSFRDLSLLVLPRSLELEWRSRAEGFWQEKDLRTVILAR